MSRKYRKNIFTIQINKQKIDKHYKVHENVVKLHNSNSLDHELAKSKVAYYLQKFGREFITECRLKNGCRPDIYCLYHSIAYEITHTEKESSIISKDDKYEVTIVALDTKTVLAADEEKMEKLLN